MIYDLIFQMRLQNYNFFFIYENNSYKKLNFVIFFLHLGLIFAQNRQEFRPKPWCPTYKWG